MTVFIGVLVVLRPGVAIIDTASLIVLCGGLAFAGIVLTTKKIGNKEPLINFVSYTIITDLFILLVIVTFNNEWTIPEPNTSSQPVFEQIRHPFPLHITQRISTSALGSVNGKKLGLNLKDVSLSKN